ncbi:MAG TPA: DMT family transporter [Firmicutes bacterium]|nr:DMT family transporter [Bacillota bacterium]
MISLLLAALSGIFMALQGSLNSALGKITGQLEATFLVHVVGSLASLGLLIFGLGQGSWRKLAKAPWYTYLGGLLGVAIIFLVVAAITKIGAAPATTAIIVGQVSTAALVDTFGLFGLKAVPFSIWQGVGLVLMAAGAWLLLSRS